MNVTVYYWIKFSDDPTPIKFAISTWEEFINKILKNYVTQRGYIEWMIRE